MTPAAGPSPWSRRVHTLLSGRREPGVYQLVTAARPDKVVNAALADGWTTWTVEGVPVTKATLLDALAEAMSFPDWFGHNWDALADCLSDVATDAPGGLLVWPGAATFAAAAPDEWAVVREVFERAVERHREHGWSFAVVCIGERPPADLPRL